MSLNDLIQEKVSQLTQATSGQSVAESFPDAPWTPGHRGRPLRMIAFDDMTAED